MKNHPLRAQIINRNKRVTSMRDYADGWNFRLNSKAWFKHSSWNLRRACPASLTPISKQALDAPRDHTRRIAPGCNDHRERRETAPNAWEVMPLQDCVAIRLALGACIQGCFGNDPANDQHHGYSPRTLEIRQQRLYRPSAFKDSDPIRVRPGVIPLRQSRIISYAVIYSRRPLRVEC